MGQFFRDAAAWEALREIAIRPILERGPGGTPIRAWIVGCRDGREAHGLAIIIAEEAERARRPVTAQIFATDPSAHALRLARSGVFPGGLAQSLSADRLTKFFEPHPDGYRVKRSVRDRIVFARLDPTEDTPLSRMDVIICSLLLKDLPADARSRAREAFLFALRAGGTLHLCQGDDCGCVDERLQVVRAEHRLFRRADIGIRFRGARALESLPGDAPAAVSTPIPSQSIAGSRIRSALLELCPPTLVVDRQSRLIYVHGAVSPFMGYPPGAPTQSVLELVRPPFFAAVRTTLQEAMRHGRTITRETLDSDGVGYVAVSAAPLRAEDACAAFRVSFLRIGATQGNAISEVVRRVTAQEPDSQLPQDAHAGQDTSELRRRLQAVTEAFEETHEALAAANEELASSNEELQSANEQLEASRGELQAANDELSGANARLAVKVGELEQAEARLNEALRTAEQLHASAEAANRAKDEFISIVSHELRTPLNTIRLWCRLLASGRVTAAQLAEGARIIDRAVSSQRQLIDDLLDVSRMATGQLRLALRDAAIAAVVENAIDAVRAQVASRGIELTSSIDPDAGELYVDPDRVQQILWNLLTNALKFTPEGGRIEVQLRRLDSAVEIDVRDTGIGIPADFLPHVFERFRQRDGGIARRHGGLGLGLAIAKELVELHGGTISARSAGPGKGATFLVRLPITRHDAQPQNPGQSRSLDPGAQDLAGLEVLVIEDEEPSRDATVQLLVQHNARVRAASTALQARAALEIRAPDVIVADIGMPDEDGYRLIASLRQNERERQLRRVPAIAVTAFAQRKDRESALAAGFDLHLSKPVDPDGLLQAVRQLGERAPKDPPLPERDISRAGHSER